MPRQICHAHCPKGGGAAGLLALGAVIAMAAIARPALHAAEVVLEVAVIIAASVKGHLG